MVKPDNIRLGCAPIAWTNDDMPDLGKINTFEQCVSEIALAGYEGTEVGNKYPKDIEELKRFLDIRNLSIASAWFSSFFTSDPYEVTEKLFIEHRDFLYEMGAKVIVVSEQGNSIQKQTETPLFEGKPVFTDEEWQKVIEGLEKLGDLAKEKGMSIVYHHHMGTGIQTTKEIDYLMENTNPDKVSLLFDTGHLVLSGEDPIEVFNKHKDRIKHIHFKDIRKDLAKKLKEERAGFLTFVREGAFTVPGDGFIDFKPISDAILEADYKGWIVVEAEQDPAKANPFEYAMKAKKYIDSLF